MDKLIKSLSALGAVVAGCFMAYAFVREEPKRDLATSETRFDKRIDSEVAGLKEEMRTRDDGIVRIMDLRKDARDQEISGFRKQVDTNTSLLMQKLDRIENRVDAIFEKLPGTSGARKVSGTGGAPTWFLDPQGS